MSHHSTRRLALTYLGERYNLGAITQRTRGMQQGVLLAFTENAPTDPSRITRRTIVRYAGTLDHMAANSRRQYLGIVRGYVAWLRDRGVLDRDPFRGIDLPKETRGIHRALDPDQVHRLFAACDTDRDLVILVLGLHVGLRREELARLTLGDISLAGRTLIVRRGKGGHARVVPLPEEACTVIGSYVARNGLTSGPLLRSEREPHKGVGAATVGRVFRDLAWRSGVKVRNRDGVATHALRHTAATDIYRACRDVMAVREVLGHAELNTTARYVRGLDVEGLRPAVEGRWYAA